MATIGSLIVNVSANLGQFQKAMTKGTGLVRGFSASVLSLRGALAGLGVSLSASLAANKILNTLQAMEDTAVAAERLGIAVEQYSAIAHAAKLANVEQDTLTKSLDVLLKKLGSGSLQKPLAKLGLSDKSLASGNTIDALSQIADAISQLPTPAARAAASFQVFGKSGQQMLEFLSGGSAGIREAAAEAERLGIVFDDLAANKIKLANDNIDRLKAAGAGLSQTMAISLAPAIAKVADELSVLLSMSSGSNAFDGLAKSAEGAAKEISPLTKGILAVQDFIAFNKTLFGMAKVQTAQRGAGLFGFLSEAGQFNEGIAQAPFRLPGTQAFGKIAFGLRQWLRVREPEIFQDWIGKTPTEKFRQQLGATAGAGTAGAAGSGGGSPLDLMETLAKKQARLLDLQASTLSGLVTPQERYNSTIANLNELFGNGFIAIDKWVAGIAGARKELADSLKVGEKFEKFHNRLRSVLDSVKTDRERINEDMGALLIGGMMGDIGVGQFVQGLKSKRKELAELGKKDIDRPELSAAGAFERGSVEAFSAANRADIARANAEIQRKQLKAQETQVALQRRMANGIDRAAAAAENEVALDIP